jgi:hypothetical protein
MIENIDFILQIIKIDFFVTFGMYSIIYLFVSFIIKNPVIDRIDSTASKMISFIGIVFLIIWTSLLITNFATISDAQRDAILDRMFGKYWFGFWLQPLLWITLTQLLRFEKIRKLKLVRLFFSLIFIATIEQIIIISTSFHQSSSSPFVHFSTLDILKGITVKLLLFLTAVGIYYVVEKKVKLLKSKMFS